MDTDTRTDAETETNTDTDTLHTRDLVPDDRDTATDAAAPDRADDADRPADNADRRMDDMNRRPDDMHRRTDEERRTNERADAPVALFDDAPALEARWSEVQVRFVDEPRRAVEDADALVAEVMRRLAETFAAERDQMEREWHAGDEVSTEDLRLALQRYRSFFQRLLAA